MNVPPWAGFVADFPDDEVEDEGDIEVYGGRNVALALGEIFKGLNCSRVSAPESAGEQGWDFDFYYEGRHRFWCRVQSFHPVFWLLLDDLSATPKGAAAYVEFWRKLGNALEQHPSFHKIIWRSFRDGPPDWAEVEAASDPPDQNFDEIFALAEFRQAAPKPGCLSIFFGGPPVFWGIIGTTQYALFDTSNDRQDMLTFSVGFLLVGLLILFWSRMRWWIDSLRS